MSTASHNGSPIQLEKLTVLLREVAEQATFDVLRLGIIPSSQLKDVYYHSTGFDKELVSSAETQIKEDLLAELTLRLRPLLNQYIRDDHIGNRFAYFVGGRVALTVKDLALELVRAAAILGPEQAMRILYGWAQGEPIPYHTCAVLSGISVSEPLAVEGGIRFIGLPSSSDVLSDYLPAGTTSSVELLTLLGAVKATIDCKARPAFYRFTEYRPEIAEFTWAYGSFSDTSLDALCEALSLACNSYVSWVTCWFECDAVKEFGRLGGGRGRRPPPDNTFSFNKVDMSQRQLEEACIIMDKRLAKQTVEEGMDLAIRRWVRSKRPTSYADQFIELRIALEAVYLADTNDELGFRLATRGAWHLGAGFNERREYQQIFREAYKLGSTAVHASGIKSSEENRKLLTDAQDLCRRGILKRLDETEEPNWNEMILGKESGAAP